MTKMPNIKGPDRNKPVSFDPKKNLFITIDDIFDKKATITPIDNLTEEQQKQLVVERLRRGSDFTEQAISGPPYTRDNVIEHIEKDSEYGQMRIQVELGYLREFLKQIEDEL
jgi:hypothetical protein